MDERRKLSTTRQSSAEIVRVNFTTLRKGGVDPNEVRLHLEAVAREMSLLENRLQEIQGQLSEAQRRAANPTFDESTLASALGTQSAAILRAAHEEAARVMSESQERSTQLFTESQQRSAQHLIEAQERALALITEAEASASQLDADARAGAERLIDSGKLNSDALVERAREQGKAILEQSNEARKTVLNDLAVKRKALHMQIDQLRAARDSLISFVTAVGGQIEGVLSNLNTSDEAARSAALEALRLRAPSPEPTEEELLSGTPLRLVPDATLAPAPDTSIAPKQRARKATKSPVNNDGSLLEDDPSGTDVVNEIFARLRKATLEERGATAPAPAVKKSTSSKPPTATGELFQRRDDALNDSLDALTKKVKRSLQDDQNVMLDRLRGVQGMITAELEDEHEQRARYADASMESLVEAAKAGIAFAKTESGATGGSVDKNAIKEFSADLAVTIVLALRKRITGDTVGDGAERANAAYKEWRGARVERLCTDAARRAFHLGIVSAAQGGQVRFYVSPNDAPCDACASDSRAGEVQAGKTFPSGSKHPPLHAGCACAVVPV